MTSRGSMVCFDGGTGSIKRPRNGKSSHPGLRNKRKAHWAKIRQEEQRIELMKSREAERAERELEHQYEHRFDEYANY